MAPGNFMTSTLSNSELKQEFRDFKLKSLSGENKFNLNWRRAAELETELEFIQQNFPNDIITGSLALNLLGLIHRKTADIDILITDKSRYSDYVLDHYDDEFSTGNRLGLINFKWRKNLFTSKKEFIVDFFINNNDSTFIEFPFKSGFLRIHNPLQIIDYKLQMATNGKSVRTTSRKHNEDLTIIFGQTPWQMALRGEI
jgi:hypothetical protein